VHQSREGPPHWFLAEGFEPAVEPDFDDWRVMIHATELPTDDRPTGRVVCEVRDLPQVRIAVHLSVETGELIALEIGDPAVVLPRHASESVKPISARLLRRVPFGELERVARHSLRWELAVRWHHEHPDVRASLGDGGQRLRSSLAAAQRPGRRGRDDAAYASLANEYVKRLSSATPVKDLAAELDYSDDRVRNMLAEARRRKLLTRPSPGKSGGQLTDKAIALLPQTED